MAERDQVFEFLNYILEADQPEQHIYWLVQTADWLKVATVSHVKHFMRCHELDTTKAEHYVNEYLDFKRPVWEGNHGN